MRQDFPAAQVQRDDVALEIYMTPVLRHLEGREPQLDLPLDVHGTPFQWRVWQELRAIPYGETRTYTQVAEPSGKPQSVRAVARALRHQFAGAAHSLSSRAAQRQFTQRLPVGAGA
jgi:O6-methylguanine-DNA--protein-cysteine methyltransferase